jgi:hypothetical protein
MSLVRSLRRLKCVIRAVNDIARVNPSIDDTLAQV